MNVRRAAVAAVVLLTAATGCGKSEAEQQADCKKAIDSTSTRAHRPEACKDLSQDDYDALLVGWTLKHSVPQQDKDTLDYYDDGSINGSIDGDQ